ncbi:MAG: glycosyltransferase [Rhodospirillales bacterium]|nr:glycosyltransferase [Rhodospirillales bacterium]
MLSVIIPALNSADSLGATLHSVFEAGSGDQIIVADGGSTDGTRIIAEESTARVVHSAAGRGQQMAAGAAAADGDWLLFLHADTVLEQGWREQVSAFMVKAGASYDAGVFKFALDDPSAAARRLERLVAFRCKYLALPYGDQGLLISRSFYQAIGGFAPIPLFEDVDIIRRIGRPRITLLDRRAITSAKRYRKQGYIIRPLLNLFFLALYFAGVAPAQIGRLYR